MTDQINVPGQDQMAGSMNRDGGAELPFPHAVFWAVRGARDRNDSGGAQYFGGFNADAETLEQALTANGIESIPTGLTKLEKHGNDGPYQVYATRSLVLAPISSRFRWFKTDQQKNRTHLQVLAMVQIPDGEELVNIGAHMISAKGLQTQRIQDAIKLWERSTVALRKAVANGAESKYFWAAYGTFGDTPNFVDVGESYITPILLQGNGAVGDEAWMRTRYVGDAVAKQMSEIYNDPGVQAWLEDWKKRKEEKQDEPAPPPNFDEGFDDPFIEDEIPF